MAVSNFEQSLDPALWRCFDEIIRFGKTEVEQIGQLLRKKLSPGKGPSLPMESVTARLTGKSHAEIERICLDVLPPVLG
ncbi:hypothetical protein H1S01_12525 [Heliobacterium chlorum]|uniref:Uncharacterized protein n=1 Tax=Heliobacterium chlorum TaxID=2698 RepID=A0ABR7T5V5_HELCL|nr:hypothetical protein [Heliobacterium chlorum]MBC9785335.1 hypothetical protein [Heliobacterium chlorum]